MITNSVTGMLHRPSPHCCAGYRLYCPKTRPIGSVRHYLLVRPLPDSKKCQQNNSSATNLDLPLIEAVCREVASKQLRNVCETELFNMEACIVERGSQHLDEHSGA